VCQDITALTYDDESFDLIVSSDVLEHVPDIEAAFRETARVLRPGGAHLFTVPTRTSTVRRAQIIDGEIVHLLPPEFHDDPLDPTGILAFWDFGLDLPFKFNVARLDIRIAQGPSGRGERVVWAAQKLLG
jgi:SAM-dependent methyltransferase